ncbi:MAG: phosphoesterase, partial [Verrucomicrobia subdivision 3 bacterium]|nr:phosphoesterase [Limisphaerales bacterium]
MKPTNVVQMKWQRLVLAMLIAVPTLSPATSLFPTRQADEDVKNPNLRMRPGLMPEAGMLFNGWGITPAGESVAISDMALKFLVSPDKKTLLAASGGYNDTGLTLLELAGRRVTQFLPLPKVWNGLAFSKDGGRIFVAGGDSGMIHIFKYADGQATPVDPVNPAPDEAGAVLGSIAVHPTTGRLYVCNEGNHEIWVLNPDTLALETKIAAGQHPHTCV